MILQNNKNENKISSQGAWDLDILPVPCDTSQWFVMLSTLQQNWNKAGCDSISNSTASLNNVDDGQADEPANILEDTDSDKELEKEWQEWSESGKPRSKKAKAKPRVEKIADWQTKHAWLNEEGGKRSAEPA